MTIMLCTVGIIVLTFIVWGLWFNINHTEGGDEDENEQ